MLCHGWPLASEPPTDHADSERECGKLGLLDAKSALDWGVA